MSNGIFYRNSQETENTRFVKNFMTRAIVYAGKNERIVDLCKTMSAKNISCIVVTSGRKPVGIVTERDILRKIVALSRDPSETRAFDIMSRPIFSISEDTDLTDALAIMKNKKIRRIIVKSKTGRISGLITQTDIINALYTILVDKLNEIKEIYQRTQRLFKDSIKSLMCTLDAKDHYTGAHSRDVAKLSRYICGELKVDKETERLIHLAGLFHDIGKIQISDSVLNKNGPLDKHEFDEIKLHPVISETILQPIYEFHGVLPIIRHHHEWYDGKGYPDGIKGEKIPIGSRIISVADSYNAMRTNRPYRPIMKREKAIQNIQEMSGKQYDPRIVKAFLKVLNKNPNL